MRNQDFIDKINNISKISLNFKIGKTGQELEKRPDAEYRKGYKFITLITWSRNSEKIDILEKEMIVYFKKRKKCDNLQVGGGAMNKKSKRFLLYVVINAK